MTRINCVPPAELSGAHLVAEYRELPRIFALVRAAIARGETPDDRRNPAAYTLGAGHVRFFYARLGYLAARQADLVREMQARGYVPTFTDPTSLLTGIPEPWHGDWQPTPEALALNRARLAERLGAMAAKRVAGSGAPGR
ncbi:Pyrimidine dimer DNA glycosylase [bacterium YEK0313]|nr:Pyrimidine dimer DNA glycosylase [bacterium YEK0313]